MLLVGGEKMGVPKGSLIINHVEHFYYLHSFHCKKLKCFSDKTSTYEYASLLVFLEPNMPMSMCINLYHQSTPP